MGALLTPTEFRAPTAAAATGGVRAAQSRAACLPSCSSDQREHLGLVPSLFHERLESVRDLQQRVVVLCHASESRGWPGRNLLRLRQTYRVAVAQATTEPELSEAARAYLGAFDRLLAAGVAGDHRELREAHTGMQTHLREMGVTAERRPGARA